MFRVSPTCNAAAFAVVLLLPAMRANADANALPAGGAAPAFEDVAQPWAVRRDLALKVEAQRARLVAEGRVPFVRSRGIAPVSLAFPLRTRTGLSVPGFHGISNFVDLDPAVPNQLLDWNCGARTYDYASGYNHGGTDFFTWPFAWLRQDDASIEIVASAPGTIVFRHDGEFDRQCDTPTSNAVPNIVVVEHADGTQAGYWHMKAGSLTTKQVGATVAAGEYLGVVGSSGFSTGPHLHFELQSAASAIIDPYAGTCNVAPGRWQSQPAYFDSAINQLASHHAPPVMRVPACDSPEVPNFRNAFARGDRIYLAVYLRDQLRDQPLALRLLRPDGSVFESRTFRAADVPNTPAHYAASYWHWNYLLPVDAPSGRWRWEVTFEGETHTHAFDYDVQAGVDMFGDGFED